MPTSLNTFGQIIQYGAAQYGSDPALICRHRTISYVELLETCNRLAKFLREKGLRSEDRVAIILPNDWQFAVTVFAAIMAKAIIVPLDPTIRPDNFLRIVRDCRMSAVVLDSAVATRLTPALSAWKQWRLILVNGEPMPSFAFSDTFVGTFAGMSDGDNGDGDESDDLTRDEIVSITYTSGSTGKPKGVMHSHRSWIASATFTGDYLRISRGDKILLPLPLHHAYSFRHLLAYLMKGGTVFVTRDLFEGLKAVKIERPHALLLVPAAVNMILRHFTEILREGSTFLDFISIGTAHTPAQQLDQLYALLPSVAIHMPYGLTEARVGFLRPSDDGLRREIFAISPGLELRIVDEAGNPVSLGQTGEIVAKGEGLMAGYWPGTVAEGNRLRDWGFATGDLGRLEPEGEITLLGRADDIVDIGGRKVAPAEVETVLNRHPCIMEAAVVGVSDPNDLMGGLLKAFVVLQNGRTASHEELIAYCKTYLEPYKMPADIVFRSSLPKSAVGKVLKRRLIEGN